MRLTYKDKYGRWCSDGSKASLQLGDPSENWPSILWGDAVDKLAAYEDTGYSPIEIISLEGEWNAMRKVVDSYRKAEEQERLMILPCKVGTPVYFIKKTGFHPELIETKIDEIGVRYGGMFIKLSCNSMYRTAISAWGKTIFLTRAKAEAAMKGESKDE